MDIFTPADILLPREVDLKKWAVVACDQYSSQPEYWERVQIEVGEEPSALHMILPEAELGSGREASKIEAIHGKMQEYLQSGLLQEYNDCMIYVERRLENGRVRKGLIGKIDLEAYEFEQGAVSPIRCTEKTVVERIPPRMRVREGAALELPHVLLLCDDDQKTLIEPIAAIKEQLPVLYDFDLMEQGGHITGWLLQGDQVNDFLERLDAFAGSVTKKYEDLPGTPMVFAVGDGNHSLATAKACYEKQKAENPGQDWANHPARYALVELENIHDEAQVFEPIHRVIFDTDPEKLLRELWRTCGSKEGYPIEWYTKGRSGMFYLDPKRSQLAVGVLQGFLDEYLHKNAGTIDYIHGDQELEMLAKQDGAIGFKLKAMEKSQLFRGVIADGALPRKTFSMGHAQDKRYYLESRKIR